MSDPRQSAEIAEDGLLGPVPAWMLPVGATVFLLAITVFLWRGILGAETDEIRRTVDSRADEVKQVVQRELGERRRSLQRMALRVGESPDRTPAAWRRREAVYLDHFHALKQLTWWRGGSGPASISEKNWNADELTREQAAGAETEVMLDKDSNLLVLSVAVPGADGGRLSGTYSLRTFFGELLGRVAPRMNVAVLSADGSQLYNQGSGTREAAREFRATREVQADGKVLTAEVVPSSDQLASVRSVMPVLVLGLGILFSTLGGVVIHLWLVARRREREAEQINSQLRREVEQRKRAERELEKSNAQLEQFAYTASHDLQEPLRSVKSFADLLEQKYQDELPDEAGEYIDFITDGAKRMKTLINDLLQLSRLQRRELEPETVPAEEIVEKALQNLHSAIEESGAEIEVGELGEVRVDPEQLAMVFQNLISNGIKFSKEDESPVIQVTAQRREDEVEFCVEDNGIGIEPEYREQIFKIFQRLHGREDYEGTGIGLAICQQIVERHGGGIRVESEPMQGSRFYFTITHG